jgi:hypothetical protein
LAIDRHARIGGCNVLGGTSVLLARNSLDWYEHKDTMQPGQACASPAIDSTPPIEKIVAPFPAEHNHSAVVAPRLVFRHLLLMNYCPQSGHTPLFGLNTKFSFLQRRHRLRFRG